MEYLKINFPEVRGLLVNGKPFGKTTQEVIEIEAGTHTISLQPPANFQPQEIIIVLEPNKTGPLSYREVDFEKI